MVVWLAGFQLAHAHRFGNRSRLGQSVYGGKDGYFWRGLGTSSEHREVAGGFAHPRLYGSDAAFACGKGAHQRRKTLPCSRRRRTTAALHSLPVDSHLHWRELLSRLERRTKGDGAHYADPDRNRPDRVRLEPCGYL